MKTFEELWNELQQKEDIESSRTAKLLSLGVHEIGKKVLEEAGETWLAAEHESDERLAEEISQLLYHVQVLMLSRGIDPSAVYSYL